MMVRTVVVVDSSVMNTPSTPHAQEVELKLALPATDPAALLRQLSRVPALARRKATTLHLHNVYYDTPEQTLRGLRVALRLRRVGSAVNAAMTLPVYRKRLDSAVRSAEAKAVATARHYDSLRDATLQQVTDLFSQARSQQELLTLFEQDILPRSRQTLEVSARAYNVGETDFLQLVDNWRQLLRHEIGYHRLTASLRQTVARLERVVGGIDTPMPAVLPGPSILSEPDSAEITP